MKVETEAHRMVKNNQKMFRKDREAHTRAQRAYVCTCMTKPAHTRLRLLCACMCTILYKTFFGSSLLSCELKFQIS